MAYNFASKIICTIIIAILISHLTLKSRKGNLRDQNGWNYIIAGLALTLFGMIIGVIHIFNFPADRILIGKTTLFGFLEWTIGYTSGFLCLGLGFYRWLPSIVSGDEAKKNIRKFSDELALNVTLRTLELNEVIEQLEREISDRKHAEQALRNSKELYSNILESMSDGIMVFDRDFNITHWNRSMEKITGIPREEIINRDKAPWKVCPHLSNEGADKMMQKAMTGSVVKCENVPQIFRNETQIFTSEIYLPLKSDNGSIRGVVGVIQDITQQKKALKELEETYKIINGSPAIVFLWKNAKGRPVQFVTSNVINTFGYSADDFISGKISYEQVIHPDDHARVAQEIIHCSKKDEANRIIQEPYRIIGSDGKVRWLDDRSFICRDEKGRVTHYQGIVLDITARRQVEEALRNSKELYSSIVESMSDGILVIDQDYHLMYLNQAMKNIFRINESDTLQCAKTPRQILRHLGQLGAGETIQKAMSGEVIASDDVPYDFNDETQGFTSQIFRPLRTDNGDIRGVVGIVRDITAKKRIETHLQQARKLEAVAELTSGIAHDFNNILTSVVGYISLARMKYKVRDSAYQSLEKAEKMAMRSSQLADTLITFSKGYKPIKKTIAIVDFIKRSLDLALSGSNIKFELTAADDQLLVEIDDIQVSQAIYNIITNSKEAMPQGGQLIVNIEEFNAKKRNTSNLMPGKYVKISIRDEGAGIDPEHLDRIFDPYFSTKERGVQKGMGMGLSISHSIIKKHKGNITVESKSGAGTTFYIFLPLSDMHVETPTAEPEKELKKDWEKDQNTKKILVMDDESYVLEVAGQMLNRLGHETAFATRGEEAIQKYMEAMESGRRFDALIFDLTVKGGMGGVEALKEILQIDPGALAFVSSGYPEDAVIVNYRRHGFIGTIVKPYNIEDMAKKISTLPK
jgi:two-component system cell cycle sensor histidine kinase/response regulator CckA